jgi:hypothetical protein
MQKLRMTYSRKLSGGLFGRSGGVHYDIDLRICMHHEGKIDRQPVNESVHWLAGLLGVSHHRCRKSWIRGVVQCLDVWLNSGPEPGPFNRCYSAPVLRPTVLL